MIVSQSFDRYDDGRKLCHHKLGQMSEKGLFGGDTVGNSKPGEACVQPIQHSVKFSLVQHLSKEILECVHSVLWGPFPVKSNGGCQHLSLLSVIT